MNSDAQINQRGTLGNLRDRYQASSDNAAKDTTFRKTAGDSGAGQMVSGSRISQPSNAPGTCPPVQTTSAPKYGQSPRAKDRRPTRYTWRSSSNQNGMDSP